MIDYLEDFIVKIHEKDPGHASKLLSNLNGLSAAYRSTANSFFGKYAVHLQRSQLDPGFGVDCYLHMIEDMLEERYKFIREGKYSNTSFDDVEKRIYGNSEIMIYHMHGLVLAQFLWFDQYERVLFFINNLEEFLKKDDRYLEIGGGHGLYLNEALRLVPEAGRFDMVDISESSLALAKGIIENEKVNYFLKNIFDFADDEKYDFITMGEVLEHVEDPLSLLNKIHDMLEDDGTCFITTPVNAPMIDHIYLFNNTGEIKELFKRAGLKVVKEKIVISEKISEEKAAKFKVPVMYAAFLKKETI
jgi:2-polyprenyl-3-methyl-5-hydroxy-6-metoxy-1,4-benzoquinol methylase